MSAEKRPIQLGYWKIRDLAQPIRLLLVYTGTEFEDVFYEQGDPPENSMEAWLSVKYTLGLDFPNLPYLIDGDHKITQSNAILRYIARKHNLCGKTEQERIAVEMLESEAMDFRNGFICVCFNREPYFASMDSEKASVRDKYLKNAKEKLKRFSDFLGQKKWFTGEEITYVDFPLYELMDKHRLFEPTILDDFDNLKAFADRFEAIPAIQEYMKSDRFMKRPFHNKNAHWGTADDY